MTLDDEPVIISEKDFAPTPSTSPAPDCEPSATANGTKEKSEEEQALDTSAIVSDDEGDEQTNIEINENAEPETVKTETVEEIMPSSNTTNADTPEIAKESTLPAEEEIIQEDSPPPPAVPSARQIVSIGTATDSYAFTFHEEELNAILSKIPPGWKVSVVSVVGAFRTGKSFLLSWFLRYLEEHCVMRGGAKDKSAEEEGKKWYERVHTLNQHEGSFDWRGGKERNTTGMWMWSDPYFLSRPGDKQDVAVLLVDTQGMFDHETTVGLTAAIFGLSTLLSSCQIYNVDKRIQEDNLQQLALFSEYGRMAFEAEEKASAMGVTESTEKEQTKGEDAKEEKSASSKKVAPGKEPFQRMEFLIRDWQNFDTEDETDIASMEAEMSAYLEHVLAERAATDLKETREQINSCFEEVSCFMMTHPGFAVIKNKYEGDVSKIDGLFLRLLDRYCTRVFDTSGCLQPKTVRGRELSAVELGTYIKSYAQMFEEIGAHFPKAETMLEATSKANNANAVQLSVDTYSEVMNSVAGPQASDYHRPEELILMHKQASEKALGAFDDMANFGSRRSIQDAKEKLLAKIEKDYDVFISLNAGRNPLLGFETYVLCIDSCTVLPNTLYTNH